MNKSILMPISPLECELIASGKKTIIVQKTKPKIPTPFKVYIYCTKEDKTPFLLTTYSTGNLTDSDIWKIGNGKVIGEFVCDEIKTYPYENYNDGEHFLPFGDLEKTCLDGFKIYDYLGSKDGYGWYISDLKIYDKPKELSEFQPYCDKRCFDGKSCKYYEWIQWYGSDVCTRPKTMTRPPVSWCYVKAGE